jgi:superfamily II DNA/RNA helicase
MPSEIQRLADTFLRSPERIEASPPSTTAASIEQWLKFTPSEPKQKRAALRELMKSEDVKNAIIFCNRKRDVAVVHRSLVKHGFNTAALHGDLDQHQRMATLEAFRNGEVTFLAASDVAARGLDIPEVSHIFNFDVPVHSEDYVHRIGRTGRAGREGYAATLVTPSELPAVRAIEDLVRKEIPWIGEPPSAEELEDSGRSRRSGGRRGRGGRKPRDKGKASDRPARQSRGKRRRSGPAKDSGGEAKRSTGERQKRGGTRAKQSGKTQQQGMGDHVPAFLKKPVRSAADTE